MIPLRVSLEGFMSYQGRQELRFDGASLCLLAGNNGAGKSTVFDAITYALFGEIRARQSEAQQHHLINVRSDRLQVELDFEVDGRAYRVRRTLTRRGSRKGKAREERGIASTVQALALRALPDQDLSAWTEEIIKNTDKVTEFDTWIQQVLGLDYKVFTASLMLQQGESEKLLNAKPAVRYDTLAALIDLSRFQRLHSDVDELRKGWGVKQADAERRLAAGPAVADEQIEAARAALTAAEQARAAAEERKELLAALALQAVRWADLQREREARHKARERDAALLARREEISVGHARWDELSRNLVPLQQLVQHEGRVRQLAAEERALTGEVAAERGPLETARAALLEDQERLRAQESTLEALREESLTARSAIERLKEEGEQLHQLTRQRQQLRQVLESERFEARRAAEQAGALAGCEAARQAARAAQEEAAQRERERHDQAQATARAHEEVQRRLARFADVADKPVCEHCGQTIRGDYAARHQEELAQEAAQAAQHLRLARAAHQTALAESQRASQALTAADGALRAAQSAHQTSLHSQGRLAEQARALEEQSQKLRQDPARAVALRPTPDDAEASALQAAAARCASERLEQKRAEEERARQVEARKAALLSLRQDRERRERALLTAERAQLGREARLESLPTLQAELRGTCESLRGSLSESWRASSRDLSEATLQALQQEARALQRYQAEHQALQQAERGGHEEILRHLEQEQEALPPAARRPPAEVKAEQDENRLALGQHHAAVEVAGGELRGLQDQRAARTELEAQRLEAARQHDLHKLVADELGPAGLQLRLVQQAERGIVDEANQLLHSMSRGALRLKLNKEDEGSGKALDLLLYNEETSEQPMPISLASGSQRFRVAIGLALAIGRYMASGARRIESVIIDEGFGCLDERGRDDMVNVLKELKAHLRRIILVSHQREFIDSFEHGYRITVRDHASTVQPLWES